MVVDADLEESSAQPVAGIVDEQLDPIHGIGEPDRDALELLTIGEVGGEHLDLDLVHVADLLRDRAQPILVAGDQHEVMPGPGQLPGEFEAQSGG